MPKNKLWRYKNQERLILNEDCPFHITEAYKTLRTNLTFALAVKTSKVVIVSSPEPGEGKSSTCSNLAVAMCQTGANVLLIDADLRKPVLHTIFKLSNEKGLSSLLGNIDNIEPQNILHKVSPTLSLVTAGPISPNPSELLGSERMSDFIKFMENHYDYVFVDTSPINMVTDPIILANKAAGILLVCRSEKSTYASLTKAVSSLEISNTNVLGLVINGVSERSHGYYRYGYYA